MGFDSNKWIKRQEDAPSGIEEYDMKDTLGKVVGRCFVNPENPREVCAEINSDVEIKGAEYV